MSAPGGGKLESPDPGITTFEDTRDLEILVLQSVLNGNQRKWREQYHSYTLHRLMASLVLQVGDDRTGSTASQRPGNRT